MLRAFQHALGERTVHIAEETRVPAEPAHDRPREKHAKHEPPSPGVPLIVIEANAVIEGFRTQQLTHGSATMDERQDNTAKECKVTFELAGAADPTLNVVGSLIPERPRPMAQRRPAARVQVATARRWA